MGGGHRVNRLAIQKVVTFLSLTLLFSLVFYRPIIRAGIVHSWLGLMWCPATGGIITRLLYQRNLRGIGWGWGKTSYQL
jgi:uncharacterized membrane protein